MSSALIPTQTFTPQAFIDQFKGEYVRDNYDDNCQTPSWYNFPSLMGRKITIHFNDGKEISGAISFIRMFGDIYESTKGEKYHYPCNITLELEKPDSSGQSSVTVAFSKGQTYFWRDAPKSDYEDNVESIRFH